jgi:hypothetical protein
VCGFLLRLVIAGWGLLFVESYGGQAVLLG